MDLVVGATGLLGTEICRRLRDRGVAVRALVRKTSHPARVGLLEGIGCEIVVGDLQDKASLDRACAGAETVITTASTTMSRQPHDSFEKTDLKGQLNLIDAAERHDVKRFVMISISGNIENDTRLCTLKREVEEHLRESGVAYTILRPSCFMEIWLSPMVGFDPQNGKAVVFGSGQEPISYISMLDVADFAVHAVDSAAAANRTIEIGGPEALAPNDVVKVFEKELSRVVQVTHVPKEALEQQYAAASEEYQKALAGLTLGLCEGDEIDMTDTLRRFPVRLTSVREYARKLVALSSKL